MNQVQPPRFSHSCQQSRRHGRNVFFQGQHCGSKAQNMSIRRTRASRMSSARIAQLRCFYEDLCEPSWIRDRKKQIKKARGSRAAGLACVNPFFTCLFFGNSWCLATSKLLWQVFSFVELNSAVISEFDVGGLSSRSLHGANRVPRWD